MAIEQLIEKWQGKVCEVKIGATKEEGGTRSKVVKIGGQNTLPFLLKEGVMPNKPVISFEILDIVPDDWSQEAIKPYKDVLSDPIAWAQKCAKEYKAEILTLRLLGAHSDYGNKSPEACAKLVKDLLSKVDLPLIILGCGDNEKDNHVLSACSEAAKGERCLIGDVFQENYKTITAAVLADGHNVIAESPIDINIAKQLNILISDMGLPADRIVMNPTIGAMGYGMEYAYSIMERARLSALAGDKMVSMPFVCFVGDESWKSKEAQVSQKEMPSFGPEIERGIAWEILTATALLQSGADLLIMRHPKAIEKVQQYIDNLLNNVR